MSLGNCQLSTIRIRVTAANANARDHMWGYNSGTDSSLCDVQNDATDWWGPCAVKPSRLGSLHAWAPNNTQRCQT